MSPMMSSPPVNRLASDAGLVDLHGAPEGGARGAAGDIGAEGRLRLDDLEDVDPVVQIGAEHDIGGGEALTENPGALLQGLSHHVDHPIEAAPAGLGAAELQLRELLGIGRLDAAAGKEQPLQIAPAV